LIIILATSVPGLQQKILQAEWVRKSGCSTQIEITATCGEGALGCHWATHCPFARCSSSETK